MSVRQQSNLKYPADTGSNIFISFGGDVQYNVVTNFWNPKEQGRKGGIGEFLTNGACYHVLTLTEVLVTNDNMTADEMIWTLMTVLLDTYTATSMKSKLTLYLEGGYLEAIGWVSTQNTIRDADEGHSVVRTTINFIINSYTWTPYA